MRYSVCQIERQLKFLQNRHHHQATQANDAGFQWIGTIEELCFGFQANLSGLPIIELTDANN